MAGDTAKAKAVSQLLGLRDLYEAFLDEFCGSSPGIGVDFDAGDRVRIVPAALSLCPYFRNSAVSCGRPIRPRPDADSEYDREQ